MAVDPDLARRVIAQIEPLYRKVAGRDGPEAAYEKAYERAVELVAEALHTSRDKARFASRGVLQEIMNALSR